MDQDDPEQRIAELERQRAEAEAAGTEHGVEQLGVPSATADSTPRRIVGRSLRSIGIGGWLATIVVAGIWLYMFGHLVWDAYGYQVGAPATATDVRCRGDANSDDPNVNCSGAWTVAGQSRSGPIHEVPENWKFGQPLDVHLHGGAAYAAGATGWRLGASLLLFAFLITMSLGGFRAVDRRWRQWRARDRR
jgi:hypothetical protein